MLTWPMVQKPIPVLTEGREKLERNEHPLLTSDRLSSLPKRDPNRFLLEYIGVQQKLFKRYDSDCNTASSRCQNVTSLKSDLGLPPGDVSMREVAVDQNPLTFGTPVLKARTFKSNTTTMTGQTLVFAKSSTKESAEDSLYNQVTLPRASKKPKQDTVLHGTKNQQPKNSTASRKDSRFARSKGHSKGRTNNTKQSHDSDCEQADRLGERRQRKKLKKTIISSRVLEQNERMESSHDKKLPNMPADFALMHGFSATNIGKNRLTLNSLRSIGVFKKGKASDKISGKKGMTQETQEFYFSETKLLNDRKASLVLRSASPSPTPAVLTESPLTTRSRTATQEAPESAQKKSNEEIRPTEQYCTRTPYNPEDSLVWDIENESASDSSSIVSSHDRATVLVSLPLKISLRQQLESLDERQAIAANLSSGGSIDSKHNPFLTFQNNTPIMSSPASLTPSQSASQLGHQAVDLKKKQPTPSFAKRTSKYFEASSHQPDAGPSWGCSSDLSTEQLGPATQMSFGVDYKQSSLGSLWRPSIICSPTTFEEHAIYPGPCMQRASFGFEDSMWSEVQHVSDCYGQLTPCDSTSECLHEEWDPSCNLSRIPYTNQTETPLVPTLVKDDFRSFESNSSNRLFSKQLNGADYAGFMIEDPYCSYNSEICINGHAQERLDLPLPFDQSVDTDESWCSDTQLQNCTEGDNWNENLGFYQGSCLLYGLNSLPNHSSSFQRLSNAEAEVATLLNQKHWLPQRL